MHLATTNRWLSLLRRRTMVFAAYAVVMIALGSVAGCASSAIPTAETASVEATAAVQATAAAVPQPAPAPVLPASPVKLVPATVVRIVDGDTAVFRLATGAEEKVRFIGVDTPESTNKIEPFGKAASAYTAEHLSVGNTVFLEKDAEERDRYGRLLAYVWLAPPTAVNETELRAKLFNAQLAIDGYAQQMTIAPNVKYADHFRGFVAEARNDGRGLWSDEADSRDNEPASSAAPAAPAGAAARPSAGSTYIGNRNTMKFHVPTCSSVSQMNPENKVALSSRSTAISQGYVPCQRCRP